MASKISVEVHDSIKNSVFSQKIENIKDFIQDILLSQNFENWELSVLFCDDNFMQNLNKEYRNIDSPTDVLSFEQSYYYQEDGQEIFFAGDIIISVESLAKNATSFSISVNEELKRLLIHGILHLSEMDHGEFHIGEKGEILDGNSDIVKIDESKKDDKEISMLVLQESILNEFKDKKIIED